MLIRQLEERLREAVRQVLPDADLEAVQLRPCPDPKFGDYQTTSLMALAKKRRTNPRHLAAEVVSKLDVSPWADPPEIAGPGFVNLRLKTEALADALAEAVRENRVFIEPDSKPRTVVLDFSSPNVAKPMHVGHIRSTILGDSLARLLRLLGHRVITDNHIGDWGTQFGKLLVGWKAHLDPAALERDPIGEMERLYKIVHAESERDEAVLEAARAELVKLQQGDPENRAIWERMIELSRHEFDRIYARLGVKFDHTLGESFYHPRLERVVKELLERGIARESQGAVVVFFDEPDLKDHPAIIRKKDGAFNYATTDLATLEYRLETWHPDEIIYVTDARQQLHFRQIFAIFRKWHPEAQVKLAHVWFGSILGEDNTPLKTRSGETIKLADLLDEAEQRALAIVRQKNPELPEERQRAIARAVGIGAVKYADLLPNRQSDYVFSWDKMLSLSGNTAPYLQYAYTRIRSIFRKGGEAVASLGGAESTSALILQTDEEIALGKQLLNFGLVVKAAAEEYRPNFICNYLYELAGAFTRFYENCPVLKAEPAVQRSRLALCKVTAETLRQGLDLLGIETLEQM